VVDGSGWKRSVKTRISDDLGIGQNLRLEDNIWRLSSEEATTNAAVLENFR
jgi:hypothetical protein